MIDADHLRQIFPIEADIPVPFRLSEPLHQHEILIGGQLRSWTGERQIVVSPIALRASDGTLQPQEIGSIPAGDEASTEAALNSAVAAYDNGRGAWPTMGAAGRIACMEDFVRRLGAIRDEVVRLLMWEIGKNLPDSQKEFDRTVDYIRATIDALKQQENDSSRFLVVEGVIGQIRRTPLGVVLCMGPYNYPLNETFATLIPAMIMGNTVVLKPPKHGVLLFQPLMKAFAEAFPPGVVNMVYGKGAEVVPQLLTSGRIDVLTLIGSSKVADHLKKLHPKVNRLRSILGLDAKNAAIVLPDADLDLAVTECLAGSLSFNGQRCTALKILLVHRAVVGPFLERFVTALSKLKVGMPWDEGAHITPLPEPGKTAYLTEVVADALAKGAAIVNEGGGARAGSLFYPAVVYPVREGMRLYREEQFGPVVPVVPFDTVGTALDYVASSQYGQQVSIFGSDADEIASMVDPLVNQVCRVNINCQCQRGPDVFPFTGRKDSAEGTLSITDALRCFSIRSMVATKRTKANQSLLDTIAMDQKSNFITTRFLF